MATDIAKLAIKLEAQTAKYDAALARSNRLMTQFAKKQKRSLNTINAGFKKLATVLAGVGFARLVTGSIEAQASMHDMSTRLGITTEALSRLQYAAEQSGVSASTLNMGLQRMVRRVSEAASGTGEAVKALDELGISAAALEKLAPEQQFKVLADSIKGVESPADRVRLAMKLFDSEGVALIQTMTEGAEGLNKFAAESDRLGNTIGTNAAAGAKKASDAMTSMRASMSGVINVMAVQLGPTIENIANFMANNLAPVVAFIGRAFDGLRFLILKFVETSLRAWKALMEQMGKLPDVLGGATFKNIAISLDGLTESLKETGDEFFQGAVGVQEFKNQLDSLPSTIGTVDTTLGVGESNTDNAPSKKKEAASDKVKEESAKIKTALDEQTQNIQQFSDTMANQLVTGFGQGFSGIQDMFGQMLQNMIQQFVASGIMNLFTSFFPGSGAALGALGGIIPGFAGGGQFTVGGQGGTDSNMVAFRATRGERVTVETPGQQMGGGNSVSLNMNVQAWDGIDVQRALRKQMPLVIQEVNQHLNDGGKGAL